MNFVIRKSLFSSMRLIYFNGNVNSRNNRHCFFEDSVEFKRILCLTLGSGASVKCVRRKSKNRINFPPSVHLILTLLFRESIEEK